MRIVALAALLSSLFLFACAPKMKKEISALIKEKIVIFKNDRELSIQPRNMQASYRYFLKEKRAVLEYLGYYYDKPAIVVAFLDKNDEPDLIIFYVDYGLYGNSDEVRIVMQKPNIPETIHKEVSDIAARFIKRYEVKEILRFHQII